MRKNHILLGSTFFFLVLFSKNLSADCFEFKKEEMIEIEKTETAKTYTDKKKQFLVTTTCQRTKFGKKVMLASHRKLGEQVEIDSDFYYLKTAGKKPFMTVLYSFGKETGTLLFVGSKLTPDEFIQSLKKIISTGAEPKQLDLIKF